ncbi:MAG: hypothetical protein A3J83_06760 [Elusimicrobia bacterium RIFOXYA2_FULL_40_6]|nr:MAG: hypothetical protein A3J83_06760 [Elusimicrobia bacterium RIFOXYA2_FULL_40_6]
MKKLIYLILFLCASVSFSQEKELSEKEKAGLIKAYYDTAIRSYQAGDYSKAVSYWEQVLQLDPSQVQPPKLIEITKQKIREKYAKALKNVEILYTSGKYTAALAEMGTAMSADQNSSELKKMYNQLEAVQKAFGEELAQSKSGELVRASVNEYMRPSGKIKFAIHAIIYAGQLKPGDVRIKKFAEIISQAYPNQAKSVEIVPGMTLVEQKLVASLNYIYDAKYDRALVECNDVLELEPGNTMAMKRLGSAYYALKKIDKAREVWRQALKLDPKDAELRSYLK